MSHEDQAFRSLLAHLKARGLLMQHDARLPSVSAMVAGGPIRGSWWGHPMGGSIFMVAERLADHRDVMICKLIGSKVTYVHRDLWPDLLAVARSQGPWQMDGLPAAARALLRRLAREGMLRTDQTPASAEPARELERRLLVHAAQVHTESGAHARALMTWERWARSVRCRPTASVQRARQRLEAAALALGEGSGPSPRLPWMR